MKTQLGKTMSLLLAMVLAAMSVQAQDSELAGANWIDLVKGGKSEATGAEVREVKTAEDGSKQLVIAIPKVAVENRSDMEEVVVVGQAPEKIDFDFIPEFQYEWVDDYDNDYYGLLIRLDENSDMPLRLYINSEEGFLR
ncbi:MAG: hypothetical protein ABJK20_18125 [Halieaceae bacterium]